MNRRWRWLLPLAALPVLALLAYGFVLDPRSIPSPLVGRPAAAFTLTAFDGTPLTLEALRGKVVVVNFWASWCNPACYDEAPVLERAWRTYRDRGVVVVGVDMQDTAEAAQEFIRRLQHPWRVGQPIHQLSDSRRIPVGQVISPHGDATRGGG